MKFIGIRDCFHFEIGTLCKTTRNEPAWLRHQHMQKSNDYLVGALEHFYDFPYIGNVIIPTDFSEG